MERLLNVLGQLGLGLATNAVYDLLKSFAGKSVSRQQVLQEIQNRISMYGVSVRAETVISALVQKGYLVIEQSHLHANLALAFGSVQGGAVIGNNSALTTSKSAITAGSGAFMETQGNAEVRQNPDGSISFHVGEGGNISFRTS